MNIGPVALQNVVGNDPMLGIVNFPVGALAVGQEKTFPRVAQRCAGPGTFMNVAQATGRAAGSGAQVTDSDPAVLVCRGVPKIDLKKQISVNGGSTFADADKVGDADVPTVPFPSGALYRLIVKNTGTVALQNVVVNDPTLGIVDFPVGALAVGQQKTGTQGQIPQLNVAQRCNSAGTFTNVATTDGAAVGTGQQVSDSDPAVLVCQQPTTCMVIIDEDGVDNDMQTVGRAATTCGVQIDQLVNDTLWPSDLASSLGFNQLFPSQAVCSANGLNTDRKVPTQCGNPPLLWNKLVERGSCGASNGNGRLVLMPTGQV